MADDLKAKLAAAEAALAAAEGPHQRLAHARHGYKSALNALATAPEALKSAATEYASIAKQELDAAEKAAATALNARDVDEAAQAVLDARAALEGSK